MKAVAFESFVKCRKNALKIELPDWIDPWHAMSGFLLAEEKTINFSTHKLNEPVTITPDFISKAITFGIKQGWTQGMNDMKILYHKGAFHLAEDDLQNS